MSVVLLFLALMAGSTALMHWVIVSFGFTGMTAVLLMWSVGLSAMLALKLMRQDLSSLGWNWGRSRYHLIAFALPVVYGAVTCFSADLAGLASFPKFEMLGEIARQQGFGPLGPTLSVVAVILLAMTAGMVNNMAAALGEEIGWRGFLTPRLTTMLGFFGATLVTGLLWASWHLPILIFSDYNGGGEKAYEVASFMVMITAMSGAAAWLRLQSGSLWPAVTFHASHNLFLQMIFGPMTTRGDSPVTMVGEFGVVTAIVCVIVCLPFWVAGIRRPWPPRWSPA
ncbi:CPBP family intramembrane glutamic endopeptidase [Caulobacter sp. 17J80-11]|uniref:CPBP family intramembrane glutamic endopeptidase n=1 Tax=Caulobacter sp. 17J80-11 TaxID=2763502 RepID=UPI001653CA8A|nr:type II CAAX endopeptidase family protein [Caulobacter sp. 17J80-11]MBC6983362.1 CPBP family intramembrane metalloprotease [Caulobacter sp. 17J80-11]